MRGNNHSRTFLMFTTFYNFLIPLQTESESRIKWHDVEMRRIVDRKGRSSEKGSSDPLAAIHGNIPSGDPSLELKRCRKGWTRRLNQSHFAACLFNKLQATQPPISPGLRSPPSRSAAMNTLMHIRRCESVMTQQLAQAIWHSTRLNRWEPNPSSCWLCLESHGVQFR